jgi:PAS domain-containing protein
MLASAATPSPTASTSHRSPSSAPCRSSCCPRAGEEESSKGLNAGANDYIAKPFGARDLVVRVAAALASARVARETQALQEAQRQYLHRLFEHAPLGIAVLRGSDHVYEVANPQYASLAPGHSCLNRSVREAFPELAGQSIYELLDRVYETGEPYVGRSVRLVVGADARPVERFFDFAYQPIPDDNGKTESILVVVFEVTELARARRDADAANRAKGEFFAILGHELRNPLAPIVTPLQLMRLRGDGAMAKERAVIERQVRQITQLVDDLMYGRIGLATDAAKFSRCQTWAGAPPPSWARSSRPRASADASPCCRSTRLS